MFLGRYFICQEGSQRHHGYSTNGLVRVGVFLSDSYFLKLFWTNMTEAQEGGVTSLQSHSESVAQYSRLPIFLFQPLRRPHDFLLVCFEVSQLRGACCKGFAADIEWLILDQKFFMQEDRIHPAAISWLLVHSIHLLSVEELHSDFFLQHYHSPHFLCLPW